MRRGKGKVKGKGKGRERRRIEDGGVVGGKVARNKDIRFNWEDGRELSGPNSSSAAQFRAGSTPIAVTQNTPGNRQLCKY